MTIQVELAHGGRGNSSSTDRHSGGRGPRGGVSRRSEYRGGCIIAFVNVMWFSRFFLTLLQLLHFALLFSYGQWFASVCFVARSQSKYSSCCSMLVCSFIKYLVYILIILCFPSRIICVGLGMFASHKFSMREVVSFLFLYMWTDGSINTHYTCS